MSRKKYWFRARKYGWGWGLPDMWQGWVAYGLFVAALGVGAFLFPPLDRPVAFLIHVHAAVVILILICWLKGEPARWRWGK